MASAALLRIDEMSATILLPARLRAFCAERLFLAVTKCTDAGSRDPLLDERLLGGVRTVLTQSQVVLNGTALVAVALDQERYIRVLLQEARIGLNHRLILRRNLVAVVLEEHVFHVLREQPGIAFGGGRSRSWRRSRGRHRDTGGRVLHAAVVLRDQPVSGRFAGRDLHGATGIDLADAIDADVAGEIRVPGKRRSLPGGDRVGIRSQHGRWRRQLGCWWRRRWRRLFLGAGGSQ